MKMKLVFILGGMLVMAGCSTQAVEYESPGYQIYNVGYVSPYDVYPYNRYRPMPAYFPPYAPHSYSERHPHAYPGVHHFGGYHGNFHRR